MSARLLSTVLTFARKSPPPVPQPPALTSFNGVSAFMQTYYLKPRPGHINILIEALQITGYLRNPHAVPPTVAFLSEIFARNRNRLMQWQAVASRQDEVTRAALNHAQALSRNGGVLHLGGRSGERNDQYWGAFFATGNTRFITRLAEQLPLWDERDNRDLFLVGASAMWSLATNAISHPKVRATLQHHGSSSDQRTRELVTHLLNHDPEAIKDQIKKIVSEQKQAGVWS